MTRLRRIFMPLLSAALLAGGSAPTPALAAQAQQPPTHPSATHKTTRKHSHRARQHEQSAPTPDRIAEIQTALARENAYGGVPNGKWDAATIAAMKKFQAANGLQPSGKLDALTLQKLGLGSEVAGRGAPVPPAGSEPTTTPATTPISEVR